VPVTSSGTGLTRPSVTLSKLPVGSGYGGSSAGRLMGHCQATREKGQGEPMGPVAWVSAQGQVRE
jgi:hypothetical protein